MMQVPSQKFWTASSCQPSPQKTQAPFLTLGQATIPTEITVRPNDVWKLLRNLKPQKATCLDDISPRFIKEMAKPLTPVLALIFSTLLKQGKVPEDWKEANVSPILKKGDNSQPVNYRPVTLTSVCSKVLKHIIHSHLIEDNQILCDQQHCFRKQSSYGITATNSCPRSCNWFK